MIHFLSGLPRSGSTLLAGILNQNPRFAATTTSGIIEILFLVRNRWDSVLEFQSAFEGFESDKAKLRVLRGILSSYFDDVSRPVIFDKSRSWLAHLEMAETILGRRVKVLVPVRDVRDVLASFERLWRETSATHQIAQEANHYFDFQTLEGRCAVWMRPDQPVGLAYNRIKDALHRGFHDRLHFVRFEDLTTDPEATLREIYDFLEEPPFRHDFQNVEQANREDDAIHGFKDLHTIRAKVEPVPPRWPRILGDVANRYAALNFW